MAATSGALTPAAAGSFAPLPSECLDAIITRLPPNCIPLGLHQLSKAWRQRYLQYTTVAVQGDGRLPAWAVLEALPHLDSPQRRRLMPALARRGDFTGMQQLAQQRRCPSGGDIREAEFAFRGAARLGRVDIVRWLEAYYGRHVISDKAAVDAAARGGHVPLLVWLREQEPPYQYSSNTMAAAARGCHVETLRWLRGHGCNLGWSEAVTYEAASGGHMALLQYATAEGCPWGTDYMCSAAAESGQLQMLQYVLSRGCAWDTGFVCEAAAYSGSLELLKYLKDHGCPCDLQGVAEAAAEVGALDMLRYAVAEGAELNEFLMAVAARGGCLQTVRWLHEQGCPWDADAYEAAVRAHQLDALQYLLQHGSPNAGAELCVYSRLAVPETWAAAGGAAVAA